MEKENRVLINARINADLREQFKIKTIKEKTTMAEKVEEFIRKYVEK